MKVIKISKQEKEKIKKYCEENGITEDPDEIVLPEDYHTIPLKEDE